MLHHLQYVHRLQKRNKSLSVHHFCLLLTSMSWKQQGPIYISLKWSCTCSPKTHLCRGGAKRASRSHKLLISICHEASIELSLHLRPRYFYCWLLLKTIIHVIFMTRLCVFSQLDITKSAKGAPVDLVLIYYSVATLYPHFCLSCINS